MFLGRHCYRVLLILIIGMPPSSVRLTHTMEEAKNSLSKARSDEKYVPAKAGNQSFRQSRPFLPGNFSEIKIAGPW